MQSALSPSADRVQKVIRKMGYDLEVVEHTEPTRTAEEAAQRAGCAIGQIVKSLIFKTAATGRPVLIFTSGANRVDERRMAAQVGESLKRADPDFVRSVTGFAIGGVPPVGHPTPIECYMDEDLLQFDVVWASAGTPNAIFSVAPAALRAMTGAKVVRVKD